MYYFSKRETPKFYKLHAPQNLDLPWGRPNSRNYYFTDLGQYISAEVNFCPYWIFSHVWKQFWLP